jgi:hypothetical protein
MSFKSLRMTPPVPKTTIHILEHQLSSTPTTIFTMVDHEGYIKVDIEGALSDSLPVTCSFGNGQLGSLDRFVSAGPTDGVVHASWMFPVFADEQYAFQMSIPAQTHTMSGMLVVTFFAS